MKKLSPRPRSPPRSPLPLSPRKKKWFSFSVVGSDLFFFASLVGAFAAGTSREGRNRPSFGSRASEDTDGFFYFRALFFSLSLSLTQAFFFFFGDEKREKREDGLVTAASWKQRLN